LLTTTITTSEKKKTGRKAVWSGKDNAPLIPDLSVMVNIPSSDSCSFSIRCGNAVRRLDPRELTTAAGGSTNMMTLPVLLSDMAKKSARP
jgi:hypothetical protein